MNSTLRNLVIFLTVALPVLSLAGLGIHFYDNFYRQAMVKEEQIFVVEKGSGAQQIAHKLHAEGMLDYPVYWLVYAYVSQQAQALKAGQYVIQRGDTPHTLFHKIRNYEVMFEKFTVVEGWTFSQVQQSLRQHAGIRTSDDSPLDIAHYLKIKQGTPEGWLYPDTYLFERGSDGLLILKHAHQAMQETLHKLWEKRPSTASGTIKTPYEMLILASIIEKESFWDDEKPMVARVFLNRLEKNMPLQSDPTVIYGMGKQFDGNLRRADLRRDTPYNTYTRRGLPPTPIAMPGEHSLRSVIQPADGEALYFVASKDDKRHYFSNTYDEHRKAVYEHQIKPRQKQ